MSFSTGPYLFSRCFHFNRIHGLLCVYCRPALRWRLFSKIPLDVMGVFAGNGTVYQILGIGCIPGMVSLTIFQFLRKVSTPKADKKNGLFEEDMVKTGMKIESPVRNFFSWGVAHDVGNCRVMSKLEKQLDELEKAGWWEKMVVLHWGTCAVIAYYG
ncbi:hypothetical protein B0H11DRAFT_1936127 [Mycena galericulata]|nr:hypothetical protein B0H11DRAFT_1936127 [Mycena galericulata]